MSSPVHASVRRARRREDTALEIRQAAREILAESGVEAVTLRGIAARLGMAATGVHYYFAARDDLLSALVIEAFDELAAVTTAAARGRRAAPAAWTRAATAYRAWALANTELFQLAHSATATRLKDRPGLLPAKDRAVRALTDPLGRAIADGSLVLPADPPPVPATLRRQLLRWSRAADVPDDPQLVLFLLQAYTLVHGAVLLAATGSLPRELLEDDSLFRMQLARLLDRR